MDISKAREYFELGLIVAAFVRPPFMHWDGWTVELSGNLGNLDRNLRTTRGHVRQFKTLDAASKAIEQIGLPRFQVELAGARKG